MDVAIEERGITGARDRTAPVVVRIGLFGGSGSGVSSAVASLGQRLGQAVDVVAVVDDDAMDWLEYEGGRHGGRSIQTQVAGVSGPIEAWTLPILESADVVLFVADTTAAGMDASMAALHELRSFTSVRAVAPTLMYLANKRDLDDVLAMSAVRSQLAIHDDESVLEIAATTGDGVRQAFVYAVREALKRLPGAGGDPSRAELGGLDELLVLARDTSAALKAHDEAASANADILEPLRLQVAAGDLISAEETTTEVVGPEAATTELVEPEPEPEVVAVEVMDVVEPEVVAVEAVVAVEGDEPDTAAPEVVAVVVEIEADQAEPVGVEEPSIWEAPVDRRVLNGSPLRREHLDDAGWSSAISADDLVEEVPAEVVATAPADTLLDDPERLATLPPPPVVAPQSTPSGRRRWGRRSR